MEPQTQKRKRPDVAAAAAELCTNGCGFFGSAATEGMCSKCYRETAACQETKTVDHPVFAFAAVPPPLKKIKPSVPAIGSSSDAAAAAGGVDTSSSSTTTTTEKQKQEGPAKPANRCVACRKKVGLTGFLCRCGGTFCGSHRYADAHSCGFDYKAAAREKIAKQNPVVVAPKLDKI